MKARVAVIVALAFGSLLITSPAGADPTGAPNALTGTADCGSAGKFTFVVNNNNGRGSGVGNNGNQAEWTPAHLNPGNGVFHPTVFNLTFTFTPTGGSPETNTQVDTREHHTGDVTCTISATATFPEGSFVLSGTVQGTIS